MKVMIAIGDEVSFDELPGSIPFGTEGEIVNITNDLVMVRVPDWGIVEFDLGGSSWSHCGEFKRDCAFVDWSD